MNWLLPFAIVFVSASGQENYCSTEITGNCHGLFDDTASCNASFSGFQSGIQYLQDYANEQIRTSYDYLLLSVNFGTYVKNRPGFQKHFRQLSDTAWQRSINLIKHITKRGGAHNFHTPQMRYKAEKHSLELNEMNALAFVLDTEKSSSLKVHGLHERYSHANHRSHYDAEIAHYLEENFIEDQAATVRKLSGYTNDLRSLIDDTRGDTSLSLHLFDEYLYSH